MHEQLKERLWCVKGRKVTVDCVMILMTAIIGRLFDKHHRFVYCLAWKLRGAYSAWGFTFLPPSPTTTEGIRPKQMCHSLLASFFSFRAFLPKWSTFVSQPTLIKPSLEIFKQSFHSDLKLIFFKKPKAREFWSFISFSQPGYQFPQFYSFIGRL